VPYVVCQACGFRAYSAAVHANVEVCPVCGTPLPRRRADRLPGQQLVTTPALVGRPHVARAAVSSILSEIVDRLGRVPTFFEPALSNPEVLRELWRRMRFEWLDSPVPSDFRYSLVEALAQHSPWPWRAVVKDMGETSDGLSPLDVEALLAAPVQDVPHTPGPRPLDDWPEPGTAAFEELLALTLRFALDSPDEEIRTRLQALLGKPRFASLIALLTYLQTWRTFAQAHPAVAAGVPAPDRRAADQAELAVLEVDAAGAIVSFSPAAEELFDYSAEAIYGRPLTELFGDEARGALGRLIDEFAGAQNEPPRERSLHIVGRRRDNGVFDAWLRVANRRRNGERGAMTAIVDVGKAGARADPAAAYRVLVDLLGGGAVSLPPVVVLNAIAETLGWELVLVWRFDPGDAVLRCIGAHQPVGELSPEAQARAAAAIIPGEGIVGTVFESGTPVWVEDLTAGAGDRGEPVATADARSGLWLPVGTQGTVDGVLELLSLEHRRTDHVLLELFSTLAREATALLETERDPPPAPSGTPSAASVAGLAFDAAPVGMALVSLEDGTITEVNPAMCTQAGRVASELVGLSIDDLTEPADVGLDAGLMRQLLGGHIPSYQVDKRFRRADGTSFWGELSVALIRGYETAEPLYLVAQLSDVSERRRIDDTVHDSRARLASVFDEAPIGMAIVTLDGRWIEVNAACCETLGYTEAELLNKRLGDLIDPEDLETVQRYLRQLFAGEVLGYHVETRAIRADGERIWVQLSVSLAHDSDGSPAYVLAEVQDVTERKRLEQELEQGALRDLVTGLPNRTLLFDRLDQVGDRQVRNGSTFAVIFVGVDGIDAVAAGFGRGRADAALREVAARLQAALRIGDSVGRYGPDEFVLVCDDLENDDDARAIVRRVLELGHISIGDGDSAVHVKVTLGLTIVSEAGESPSLLVERADTAMQIARRRGIPSQEYAASL